jgi:hypothetical protein
MSVTASQISLVLSGGSGNNDPTQSLGGMPSSVPIVSNQMDNLFEDVPPADTETGLTDYRCMYIFNDGTDTVFNCQVWLGSVVSGGSNIFLGIAQQDEVQRISIAGTVTAGTVTFGFGTNTFTSDFDVNVNIWASNIALLMNGLLNSSGQPILSGVTVSGQISGGATFFDITFGGFDGGRDQDLLTLIANNLSPTPVITIQLLVQGGPVNTIAPTIDVDTTPPTGVTFTQPTSSTPLTILQLNSGDGFPLWAQRVTPAGAASLAQDGFNMLVQIESLPPVLSS